jgi:hypothetical protein
MSINLREKSIQLQEHYADFVGEVVDVIRILIYIMLRLTVIFCVYLLAMGQFEMYICTLIGMIHH